MKKNQSLKQFSFPEDVAIKIVSFLEVSDVCSFGSCSRFWREICGCDFVWKCLCKERWPTTMVALDNNSPVLHQQKQSNFKGWKEFYREKHIGITRKVASMEESLSCEPINVDIYLKEIEDMNSMKISCKDVQMLFLKPEINVLLNLIGLHYCIRHLGMKVNTLRKVISSNKIEERQISVEWCKQGGWVSRFPLPNELHFHCVSLGDLLTKEGNEVLEVLDGGITYQVSRVQISTAPCPNGQWCHLSFGVNCSKV